MFPPSTKDQLVSFAFHSTRMERIPISKQDIHDTISGGNPNPWLTGQLTCVNLVNELATNPDLLPSETNTYQTPIHLKWMIRIHKNLMNPVAKHGEMMIEEGLIKTAQVGRWRQERHFIDGIDGKREMPSPIILHKLLNEWFTDLIDFHNNIRHNLDNSNLIDNSLIKVLADKAYESNLKICCMKPFIDGSNRVARLTENLLRQNWGLPWKTIKHEEEFKRPYIADIKEMQKQYPES